MSFQFAVDYCNKRIEGIEKERDEMINRQDDFAVRLKDTSHFQEYIKLLDYNIKLTKLEKQIYVSVDKHHESTERIFDLLKEKYQNLMTESIEISSGLVTSGVLAENTHLEYCSDCSMLYNCMKTLCDTTREEYKIELI